MCWCELIDITKIPKRLIRTIMVIVLSLSNLESGLSSYVSTENSKVSRDGYSIFKYKPPIRTTDSESLKPSLVSKLRNPSFSLVLSPSDEDPSSSTTIYTTNTTSIKHHLSKHSQSRTDLLKSTQNQENSSNGLWQETDKEHRKLYLGDTYFSNNFTGNYSKESMISTLSYFITENSTVVTTQIGATALIPCTVQQIGEGVVTWIRKKDYHLLTVGLTTYSSDERFSASHLKHTEDWTLQIKFVQQRDAGIYECQISTHPPSSIFLHLVVVEARAEIAGPPIRYLTPGSTLRLQCRIVQNTEASEYIFWYHDNRMINFDSDRGINVSTDSAFQSSELTVVTTRRDHSGNYTCVASNTQPASVLVHIFKGDNPAAMYHGHVGSCSISYQMRLFQFIIVMIYHSYVKRILSLL